MQVHATNPTHTYQFSVWFLNFPWAVEGMKNPSYSAIWNVIFDPSAPPK